MLTVSSSTSAWRLSCTARQDGAMILSTKISTRFAPILNIRRCSRPHATCVQDTPVDQVDVDLIQHQLNLKSPVDTLRCLLLNDTQPLFRQMHLRSVVKDSLKVDFPINGQMLNHSEFRQHMAVKQGPKFRRRLMREQLLRCQTTQDLMRVLAVAFQRKETTRDLVDMDLCIVRALYRARDTATDHKIFGAISTIVSRFRRENLPLTRYLLAVGIKFAARTRSLPGMKRYLMLHKELGFPIAKTLFRAIIAKCSVGVHGYGEIRNGRWSRRDLLQVLLGFEDTPPEGEHHLGLFLDRTEWTQLYGWLVVLSRCKASDELWKEWLLWQDNPLRLKTGRVSSQFSENKLRGDYSFIEMMADAGDTRRAWDMLGNSGIAFKDCRTRLRRTLLRDIEYATVWDDQIPVDLLAQYDFELKKVENALGVEWISLGDDQGYHKPTETMKQSLEALSSPFFKLEPDFGYPHDLTPEEIKKQYDEMMLHVEDMSIYLPKTTRNSTKCKDGTTS
ncbi:hypothetical protein KCU85_g6213, partial [Aureobasidium melanogenum]